MHPILKTRRATCRLLITFEPRFHGYRLLNAALARFEREGRVYTISKKLRFALIRRATGPELQFEAALLNDPLFGQIVAGIVRDSIGIANEGGWATNVVVEIRRADEAKKLLEEDLPLTDVELSQLALDVETTRDPALPEFRIPSLFDDDNDPLSHFGGGSSSHFALVSRFAARRTFTSVPFDTTAALGEYRRARAAAKPAPPAAVEVSVFYATDRKPTGNTNPHRYYGFAHDDHLHFGVCTVSIPKTPHHQVGRVETPSIFKLEFRPNPAKHIILVGVSETSAEQFYRDVADTMEPHDVKRAFVFVHGYNVTFEDAARRTAQIHHDLGFRGAPILYSWPSRGTVGGYKYDEARVSATRWHLAQFMIDLWQRTGATEIHVIAHSMGNRAVTAALDQIHSASAPKPPLRQVVLAAPDLDATEFRFLAAQLAGVSARLTLYGSSKDKAIRASKLVHRERRAGEGGPYLVLANGVDSIDASALDTDFLAHSYIGDHSLLLNDLHQLVDSDLPPDRRFAIEKRAGGGWQFRPA